MPALIIPLEAIEDGDEATAGPKAVSLARMLRAGLPVPGGFCLTGRAFRDHLEAARIKASMRRLAGPDPKHPQPVLSDIRRAIAETPLPEALAPELGEHLDLLGEGRLAVRSSA